MLIGMGKVHLVSHLSEQIQTMIVGEVAAVEDGMAARKEQVMVVAVVLLSFLDTQGAMV